MVCSVLSYACILRVNITLRHMHVAPDSVAAWKHHLTSFHAWALSTAHI